MAAEATSEKSCLLAIIIEKMTGPKLSIVK
jgi:hypothetical protein